MKFKCFRYIQDTGDPNWWVRSRENSPHHGQAEEGFSWSVAWEKFADGRRTSKGAQCCRHPISERAPKAKVKFNGRIIMIQITYEPLKREISNQFTSWAPLTSIDRLLHYCQYLVSKHPPPDPRWNSTHELSCFRNIQIHWNPQSQINSSIDIHWNPKISCCSARSIGFRASSQSQGEIQSRMFILQVHQTHLEFRPLSQVRAQFSPVRNGN